MSLWDELTAVVPFRLASARFPEKALARFHGASLLEHAIAHAATLSSREVVVSAPPADLERARAALGGEPAGTRFVPSSDRCRSATDRLLELYPALPGDFLLSLPVDEPALDPAELRRAAPTEAAFGGADVLTFFCPFHAPEDHRSPLSAKLVLDAEGMLLYLSRAEIPVRKDGAVDPGLLKKNVGAFLFRRSFLERLAERRGRETILDRFEGLEQLRWLELGFRVRALRIAHTGFGVDLPEQLSALEERCPR